MTTAQKHEQSKPQGPFTAPEATSRATDPASPTSIPIKQPPSRKRGRSRILTTTVAVGLMIVVTITGLRYMMPRDVERYVVSREVLVVERKGPGTLDANSRTTVSAKIQGRLIALHVDRNDLVKANDVIAEIASEELRQQLQSSLATQEAARLAVLQARSGESRVRAGAENARQAFERQETLLKSGSTSRSAYEQAQAQRRQAEADLEAASAAIEQAEAQEQAAAALTRVIQAQLDETVVRAPSNGVVISRSQNVGNVVAPGSPIVEIIDPATIVLITRFDESAIGSMQSGQTTELRFVSEPERAIPGSVVRLSRHVDAETREFTVDVAPQELPRNWAIGQRGTAIIAVQTKSDVIAVPSRDIVRRDGQAGLWIVDDGRALWRPVELGEMGDALVEVRSGLEHGETVLSPGRIFHGMRIDGKTR